MWEHYKTDPARGKRFANSMEAFTSGSGMSPSFLISGYPWSNLAENSTVVDMGGSEGHVSLTIAKANPHLKLVVQDLSEVIDKISISKYVSEGHRIQFMVHDFFTPQTLVADAYLLRWILHNWPDSYVIKIFRNLIPALRNGAKVIVNDQLIPSPGSVPLMIERQIR